MTNLGIVYSAEQIERALATTYNAESGYELVGLAFSRVAFNLSDPVERNNFGGFMGQLAESRRFDIDAIFYRTAESAIAAGLPASEAEASFADQRIDINPPVNHSMFVFQDSQTNTFDLDDNLEITPSVWNDFTAAARSEREALSGGDTTRNEIPSARADLARAAVAAARGSRLASSHYQFWNDVVDFVFFGKAQLEAILINNPEAITVSGAEINYGTGLFDVAPDSNANGSFSTLKAEPNFRSTSSEYLPDVVMGLPCPPIWGSGQLAVNSGNSELASREAEISWRKFALAFIDKIQEVNGPSINPSLPKGIKRESK
ncbi:hypothetical protein [Flavilitoribacter nigricans]|uniref:Uncharacterized protein n=1 Tax=Flavilitoribacter nigricans (strain ATCC 23147 / DSM 23189 / NBRC 102662 / NCIMB 1420 / SS-2) TaxID=1122177 RepID=A0A2D0N178_FLAN2|nr:hypothetical protein [Flavilitoribacter nigricans]PHN02190.1 hypothetical protein CRP01_33180 [Flavilitoribacter nigricans DSM 23189 = NBRC 102662]